VGIVDLLAQTALVQTALNITKPFVNWQSQELSGYRHVLHISQVFLFTVYKATSMCISTSASSQHRKVSWLPTLLPTHISSVANSKLTHLNFMNSSQHQYSLR
jgi:hypothetical protein